MDPNQLEEVPILPENVVAYQLENGYLPNLGPSLQFPKPMALSEAADQVYETVLCKEVCHSLDLRAHCFVKVHVQDPKGNGVPKELQGFLQVSQVLQRLHR